MRRREKFVLSSALLSILLMGVLLSPLSLRMMLVGLFTLITYVVASWALSEDLQKHERWTILPFPAWYATAVSAFYVVLPEHWGSRVILLLLFGMGMYAILLTCNIFTVAKGRSIQLLYAAHASQLFFTLLISLLLTNTIFSLYLPFYLIVPLVGLVHLPLIFHSIWTIRLMYPFEPEEWQLTLILTLIVMSITLGLVFFPLSVWQYALLVMSTLYMGLGIFQNHLKGRLFSRTLREYAVVAGFTILMFILIVPLK